MEYKELNSQNKGLDPNYVIGASFTMLTALRAVDEHLAGGIVEPVAESMDAKRQLAYVRDLVYHAIQQAEGKYGLCKQCGLHWDNCNCQDPNQD